MNDSPNNSGTRRSIKTLLLSPWGIAAVLVGIFLLAQGYLAWRDRGLVSAIESYEPFAAPPFDLQFSRKLPYDPLSFLGRGAQAGFWQWTPAGLVLTDEGHKFFEQAGDQFLSRSAAGRRTLKRVRSDRTVNGQREVEFFYEWAEISPPAAVLPLPPPRAAEEYLGQASLVQEGGVWKVTSLQTRDFEEPMARLKDAASGVRK